MTDAGIDIVAFEIWHRGRHPAPPRATSRETWVWLPAGAKRQWIEEAKEILTRYEEAEQRA